MIYIDGLGYVDESIYGLNNTNSINNSSLIATGTEAIVSDFSRILATETANLDNQSKTYNLDDIFEEAAKKYNVDANLLKAIAYNESRFQADVTSEAGAMGIMQLMPSTAKAMGVENAYDPYESIMGGAKLLNKLSEMFDGDTTLMIAAYNAGAGNVEKYGGVPPFKETKAYVEKVLNTLNQDIDTSNMQVTSKAADSANVSYNANSIYNTISASSTGSTYQTVNATTNSILNNIYGSSNTVSSESAYTYTHYELLMTYFQSMLDIIASMGDDGSSSSDDLGDNSLADLFRLGNTSITYNRSTINL
ncbi:MAG: lytic transglycosylase domain-containing protein [Lachnospiraceae bacterium]|nr:lytic transglycosylase domain-containing protein [Lachnospiraceae bacterium]